MTDAQRSMLSWQGRVALVTGASAGIGRAVAERLACRGMKVAVCARRAERLQELQAQLPHAELLCVPADLRRADEIEMLFAQIRAAWGGVDVLVNNAGLGYHSSLIHGERKHWQEMLELNVLALCSCTQQAIADMLQRGTNGYVIHLSSMAAHRVPPGSGVYSASKHAVRALTEGLRQELRALGSSIRVSSVSPGFVETEFHEVFFGNKEQGQQAYKRFKVLEARDIADTVEFLLTSPAHMQVHDVLLRPTAQTS